MSAIIISILAALVLVLVSGAQAFGPGITVGVNADLVVFVVACLFTLAHIGVVIRASRDHRKTENLTLTLENANIKLTQLDKLKSEFLSFASHQIKAPMTVVKGYTQLILDGSFGTLSEQLRDIVEKIKVSSDRMIGLVDTFLDLRKLDEGRMQYHMEPLDLGALVASVTEDLRQLAERKKLRLILNPPAQSWQVSADAQHLRQVLQNLVDNAIKYTDTGSVTVSLAAGETPETVRVDVADTGRGISRELAPRLFEQFSRDQSVSKEIAGTGLGLYIAKRIIDTHHGRLWATSPGPGKGSIFSLELPTL